MTKELPLECVGKCGALGPMRPVDGEHAGWLCPKCCAEMKQGWPMAIPDIEQWRDIFNGMDGYRGTSFHSAYHQMLCCILKYAPLAEIGEATVAWQDAWHAHQDHFNDRDSTIANNRALLKVNELCTKYSEK